MKRLFALSLLAIICINASEANDSTYHNDFRIARVVRKAVRDADSTLLHSPTLQSWREYLKIAAMELNYQLQPLVLIKFDEDIAFRNQLKALIEWERDWKHTETDHYIYYYRWDHPLPELILQIQEAHFNEVSKRFGVTATEKIPYRYDITAGEGTVYPFDDLRGGIVSAQPLDLEKATEAILNFVDNEPPSLIRPLCRIYGGFFQNESTADAYYQRCLQTLKQLGYVSALDLYQANDFRQPSERQWASAYAFAYDLDKEFGSERVAELLRRVHCKTSKTEFQKAFESVIGVELSTFERRYVLKQAADKL